jgi:PKD repeat protein
LLPGETIRRTNIFVYTRTAQTITRVSLKPDGSPFSTSMGYSSISGDGRYVLYGNLYNETYLHDRDADEDSIYDEIELGATSNRQLFMVEDGVQLTSYLSGIASMGGALSTDGRYAMFEGKYQVGDNGYGLPGIFIYDIATGITDKIAIGDYPHMSGNGRYLTYVNGFQLPELPGSNVFEVYRWDRDPDGNGILDEATAQEAQLASVTSAGVPSAYNVMSSAGGELSEDGRFVTFNSYATDLSPDHLNESRDVFVHDFQTGETSLLSLANEGYPLNEDTAYAAISDDGRFISFSSESDAVVAGDDNQTSDVFMRDTLLGTTTLVTGKANRNLDVYLRELPDAVVAVTGPTEGGLNRDYQFTATLMTKSGHAASSYTWQVSDQPDVVHTVSSTAIDSISVQWSTPGTKTIQVTAVTSDGSVSASKTFQVHLPPVADFDTQIEDIGNGDYWVNFINASTGAYTAAFLDLGTGMGGSLLADFYDFLQTGQYTFTLTVTGPGGMDVFRKTIQVGEDSTPVAPLPVIRSGNLGLPNVSYRSSAWGDYNQDGAEDLLVSGCADIQRIGDCDRPFARIYTNRGGGVFTDLHAGLAPMDGNVAWVDIEQDGRLDAVVSGLFPYSTSARIAVYHNLGNDRFVRVSSGLPVAWQPESIFWVDINQDSYPDAVVNRRIYRNTAAVFSDTQVSFAQWGAADWGDFDGDGDLDFLTTGTGSSDRETRLYRNDGATFTEVATNLPDLSGGAVSWVDYDQDGTLDVLLAGQGGSGSSTRLYRSEAGNFTDMGVNFPTSLSGRAIWADFDQDGDLDLLTRTGLNRSYPGGLQYYRLNHDANNFITSHWTDFDLDGMLDVVISFGCEPDYSGCGTISFFQNSAHTGALQANFHADTVSGISALTVHFTNESIGDFLSSDWDFGDGSVSTEANPTHTYTSPGLYTVRLTVTSLAGESTKSRTGYIAVHAPAIYLPTILH